MQGQLPADEAHCDSFGFVHQISSPNERLLHLHAGSMSEETLAPLVVARHYNSNKHANTMILALIYQITMPSIHCLGLERLKSYCSRFGAVKY